MEPNELAVLLCRARDRSEEAEHMLMTHFGAVIRKTVRACLTLFPLLCCRVEVDDLVLDVCDEFFTKVREGKVWPDAGAVDAYLRQCARNKVVDAYRKHVLAQRRSGACEVRLTAELIQRGPLPEEPVDDQDELEHYLESLLPEERKAVTMHLEGAKRKEIARELEVDVRTVCNILHRFVELHAQRALERER